MFNKIESWANMPDKTKLGFLMAAIIVAMGFIIRHQDIKAEKLKIEHVASKVQATTREAALEARLDICNQNYLMYLRKSEQEYRDLLFEAKQLKRRNHEYESN